MPPTSRELPHAAEAAERRPAPAHDRGPDPAGGPDEAGAVRAIRGLERRMGIYRPGRSPWVWVLGPGLNLVGTVAVTTWVGLLGGLGWAITAPLALFCGVAMGIMAWAFIGNTWEQEEDERRAAEASTTRPASPPGSSAGEGGGPAPEARPG